MKYFYTKPVCDPRDPAWIAGYTVCNVELIDSANGYSAVRDCESGQCLYVPSGDVFQDEYEAIEYAEMLSTRCKEKMEKGAITAQMCLAELAERKQTVPTPYLYEWRLLRVDDQSRPVTHIEIRQTRRTNAITPYEATAQLALRGALADIEREIRQVRLYEKGLMGVHCALDSASRFTDWDFADGTLIFAVDTQPAEETDYTNEPFCGGVFRL